MPLAVSIHGSLPWNITPAAGVCMYVVHPRECGVIVSEHVGCRGIGYP